jgi:hypothetical protein
MRVGVLKKRGSSIRWGWEGAMERLLRGLLKLRTSFYSASDPPIRKDRLALPWWLLWPRLLLLSIIKILINRPIYPSHWFKKYLKWPRTTHKTNPLAMLPHQSWLEEQSLHWSSIEEWSLPLTPYFPTVDSWVPPFSCRVHWSQSLLANLRECVDYCYWIVCWLPRSHSQITRTQTRKLPFWW